VEIQEVGFNKRHSFIRIVIEISCNFNLKLSVGLYGEDRSMGVRGN